MRVFRRLGVRLARGRVAAAAVGLAAAGFLVLVPAAPASAAAQPAIGINGPAPGATFSSPSVVVTGSANFTPDVGFSGYITDLKVAVTFAGGSAGSCENSSCGPTSSFSLTPSRLSYNGPYSVSATVTTTETLLGLTPQQGSNSAATNFNMAVKPAAPARVSAQVNGDGTVTVSWARNSEPDTLGYQVQRRDLAKPVVGFLPQASSGSTVTWTDPSTAQGGNFGYVVTAFRPGADGTANTLLASPPGSAAANVPVPPPPSTTVPPIGSTSVPGTTTTLAPAQSAGSTSSTPDLSAFLAQAGKSGALPKASGGAASRPSPAPQLVLPAPAGPPDTYDPTLPFGAAPARRASGGPRVALPGPTPAVSGHHQSLLFSFAGGLLLCVLGLAVRNANRRPDGPPPLTSLRLDGDGPDGGTGAATAGVRVIPASAAAKAAAREAARAARAPTPPPPVAPVVAPAAAAVTLEPVMAPADAIPEPPPPANSPPPARAVEEAVDYFRLIKPPPADAEEAAPVS